MNPHLFCALGVIDHIRLEALEVLKREHKLPALILLYAFIDICSSLAAEKKNQNNQERFVYALKKYVLGGWDDYTPYDLWAARCSLLHAYSPIGDHAQKKENRAKPIFYYIYPETEEQFRTEVAALEYTDFLVLDMMDLKIIANDVFNGILIRAKEDSAFAAICLKNAEHILKDMRYIQLEKELNIIQDMTQDGGQKNEG
ncbi:MAG: hypothetical protein Q7U56_13355 [Humidesulfovibrio sp.]|nr:hypothetical protein [Humidesulfovibrio sp.]